MDIKNRLTEQLDAFQSAPFLFVGSGLSRRYLDLETWKDLLHKFSDGLARPFEYYLSRADSFLPRVASLLAEEFHEYWWSQPSFEESRKTFASLAKDRSSCLKFEIAKHISSRKHFVGRNEDLDKEVQALRSSVIDGAITTNWDTFLESIFPEFSIYIGQESILASQPQGIAEIYKIHGCSSQPNSLVLTEEDYKDFNSKNPYLAAKLLTIFIEHPVVFLGYSISDPNIQAILKQVSTCLSPKNVDRLMNHLIFVNWNEDANTEATYESTVLPIDSINIPITIIRASTYQPVFEAISTFKRRFPAKILRSMKEHVYELVRTSNVTGKLFVVDLEKAERFSDLEVVYGVGVSERIGALGYAPITLEDLLRDTLGDSTSFEPSRIVEETLPRLLKTAKYVPIFKYLRLADQLQGDKVKKGVALDKKITKAIQEGFERFLPPSQYRKKQATVRSKHKSIDSLVRNNDPEHAIFLITLLSPDKISIDDLKAFLLANLNLLNSGNTMTKTYFKSVICAYDWLRYARQ